MNIDRVVTSAAVDGETRRLSENSSNAWVVGDDHDVIVIDPGNRAEPIIEAIGGRFVTAVICTDGRRERTAAAPDMAHELYAPLLIHPADDELWRETHGDARYMMLHDRQEIAFAGMVLTVLHTPGRTTGSVCLYADAIAAVFTGDTLRGREMMTGRRTRREVPTLAARERLSTLPSTTTVLPGRGEATTVGAVRLRRLSGTGTSDD
ncbi:MBL fold metallo-hydrolase [Gordonia insulae]|uniref:Hydroxyacylglutathione hydrolase GloC n=1 Tax=Gordonia insulae TaxID=2420509 RepID=A0A3G8JQN2_9ACTN|nr:MBL fold metallo-hydrolase [Gordonia insulae]AZG46819.1 Hydroxyacylglutathione hydrolase GloC [Gordonia insulae]